MTGITDADVRGIIGTTVTSEDGEKIGKVIDLHLDEDSGEPEWGVVKTGWFGSRVSFVPLVRATRQGDELTIPFSKSRVRGAPTVDPDAFLDVEDEIALYRYYGIPFSQAPSDPRMHVIRRLGGEPATEPAQTLDELSKAELYERAKELGIPGRSKMTKQQLRDAIAAT